MNRLSLCQLTVETGAPMGGSLVDNMVRLISAAAGAGFDAVVPRLRVAAGLGAASVNDNKKLNVKDVVRRLADTGLSVPSVMSFWITPEMNPGDFEASLDAAAAIGAHSIQAVCHDPDGNRAIDKFSQTCDMAARRNLKVALEFMAYGSVRSLVEVRSFLAKAEQANAGICLDALHFYRSGSSISDLAALAPQELVLVQFCDAVRVAPSLDKLRDEARTGRLYPGQGELPLDEFYAAIPAECLIDIEAPCAADAALSVEQKAENAARATVAFLARQNAV